MMNLGLFGYQARTTLTWIILISGIGWYKHLEGIPCGIMCLIHISWWHDETSDYDEVQPPNIHWRASAKRKANFLTQRGGGEGNKNDSRTPPSTTLTTNTVSVVSGLKPCTKGLRPKTLSLSRDSERERSRGGASWHVASPIDGNFLYPNPRPPP
jgi:hypothetical protein